MPLAYGSTLGPNIWTNSRIQVIAMDLMSSLGDCAWVMSVLIVSSIRTDDESFLMDFRNWLIVVSHMRWISSVLSSSMTNNPSKISVK